MLRRPVHHLPNRASMSKRLSETPARLKGREKNNYKTHNLPKKTELGSFLTNSMRQVMCKEPETA